MTLTSTFSTSAPRRAPVAAIAIGASVGVHGVLFALLPLLPNPTERIRDTSVDPVPVVELSAVEQQRLPNLDRPRFAGLPNDGSAQFGFTPPPPNGSLFPNPTTQLPQTPTGRSRFTPRPAVPRTAIPRTSIPRAAVPRSLPRSSGQSPMLIQPSPGRSVPRQPSSQLPSVLPGTPTTPSTLPNSGASLGQGDIAFSDPIPELQALDLSNGGEDSASTSASGLPSRIEPTIDLSDLDAIDPTQNGNDVGFNSDTMAIPSPDDPANDATNDATNGTPRDTEDPPAVDNTGSDPVSPLEAEFDELQAYVADPDPALLAEPSRITATIDAWLTTNGLQIATDVAPIELDIVYELRTCLPRDLPQPAAIYAVIDPTQGLLSPPELFASTGYVGLDEAAIAVVENFDFSTVELTEADFALPQVALQFRVNVEYDPEACLAGFG